MKNLTAFVKLSAVATPFRRIHLKIHNYERKLRSNQNEATIANVQTSDVSTTFILIAIDQRVDVFP